MFELPELPYALDALAPYMSAETLEFHHGKHHRAYVDKLNELVVEGPYKGMALEDVIRQAVGKPEDRVLFNQAGQHWNHCPLYTSGCSRRTYASRFPLSPVH
ncbi:hypothetical protein C2W62_46500 [Candidatus Entotheonella serta]|nr:hypothetical protein C2W62_46500 [Candidatus Entotheonella serta]